MYWNNRKGSLTIDNTRANQQRCWFNQVTVSILWLVDGWNKGNITCAYGWVYQQIWPMDMWICSNGINDMSIGSFVELIQYTKVHANITLRVDPIAAVLRYLEAVCKLYLRNWWSMWFTPLSTVFVGWFFLRWSYSHRRDWHNRIILHPSLGYEYFLCGLSLQEQCSKAEMSLKCHSIAKLDG